MNDKVFTMIGFARKAGKITTGFFATSQAINKNRAKMVLYDENLSGNTKDKLLAQCSRRSVRTVETEAGLLAMATGKENIHVAGITDKMFSDRIKELIDN